MDDLAAELGVEPVLVPTLRRDPGPADLLALARLVWIMRAQRPHIVHTHAAKAGTLGRLAALIAFPNRRTRPVLVHTFHGHSLTGYFSQRTQAVYKTIERLLARRTDTLIAVSQEVQDELVELGVAEPDRFEVVPLGFDLAPFAADTNSRARARRSIRDELAIPASATVVTLIARLVPIKRVDRFLASAVSLLDLDDAYFLIVGDGELSGVLQNSPEARAIGQRLVWAGFRRDVPAICAASDVVVLTSDNEGTPVSLIEAGAAGVPAVSTRVGGAAKVIRDWETGVLVARDGHEKLASAVRRLAQDAVLRAAMGEAARAHVFETFSLDRLVADLDALYRGLLSTRSWRFAR
jgi:glycosyltransferase involved in cell wall biosynthesis